MCSVTWDEIDAEAERQGAAVLRLYRRTGACSERTVATFPVPAPNSTRYNRVRAIEAFERLFNGESLRQELPQTRADRERQSAKRRQRELDRMFGMQLVGMQPEQARAALRSTRYRA